MFTVGRLVGSCSPATDNDGHATKRPSTFFEHRTRLIQPTRKCRSARHTDRPTHADTDRRSTGRRSRNGSVCAQHETVQRLRAARRVRSMRVREERFTIGLQIVGPPWGEESVLRLAHAFEQANDAGKRRPVM